MLLLDEPMAGMGAEESQTMISLLNELEQKVRELLSALENEREKNSEAERTVIESQKLSRIEENVQNLTNLLDQLEKD